MSTDKIQVGDQVRTHPYAPPYPQGEVLAVHEPLDAAWVLWGGCQVYTNALSDLRKVVEPTPLPERWQVWVAMGVAATFSRRDSAHAHAKRLSGSLGVMHVRPDGSTEFTRTEDLP